jgi:putative nucleotidyltransferase with HDIG domain
VEDLNSTNGTFLNGTLITKAPVKSGDLVGFGNFVYSVHIEPPKASKEAPPPPAQPTAPLEPEVRIKFNLRQSTLVTEEDQRKLAPSALRAGKDLATIYRIGNVLTAEHDLERLFDLILVAILDAISADRAFLLISEDGENLIPRACRPKRLAQGPEGHSFSYTVAKESLQNGLSILTYDAQSDLRYKGQKSVVAGKIRSVICVPVRSNEMVLGVIYLDTLAHVKPFSRHDLDLLSAVGLQAGTAIQRARLTDELRLLFYDTVSALVAAVEAKDAYTKGHSERVAAIGVKLSRYMALPSDKVQVVHLGGLLHDIGKIGVAENVLNKAGKLTAEEWKIVYNHPAEGAKIVQNVRNTIEVVKAIRYHHEAWAGNGYPDGIKGDQIPLTARILAVADGFDAMTSPRSYRPAMPEEQAIEQIRLSTGTRYDPHIVEAFIALHSAGGIDLPALYRLQGLKIERM